MLNIFTLANGRLFQEEIESLEELSLFLLDESDFDSLAGASALLAASAPFL